MFRSVDFLGPSWWPNRSRRVLREVNCTFVFYLYFNVISLHFIVLFTVIQHPVFLISLLHIPQMKSLAYIFFFFCEEYDKMQLVCNLPKKNIRGITDLMPSSTD